MEHGLRHPFPIQNPPASKDQRSSFLAPGRNIRPSPLAAMDDLTHFSEPIDSHRYQCICTTPTYRSWGLLYFPRLGPLRSCSLWLEGVFQSPHLSPRGRPWGFLAEDAEPLPGLQIPSSWGHKRGREQIQLCSTHPPSGFEFPVRAGSVKYSPVFGFQLNPISLP